MANTINTNFFPQFKNTGTLNRATNNSKASDAYAKNSYGQYAESSSVEISSAGMNALNKTQSDSVDEFGGETDKANASDESKLSAKAQSLLEKLREKYGDYDFVVSDDLDADQTVGGTKSYSVMFTTEELERMAEDEEYTEKVMGKVGESVDMLKELSEKDLGEGVKFSQLSVSIDGEGNMKLFAQLEKLSTDQQERLEAAKERRAEQEKLETEKSLDDDEPISILYKSADVEADNAEDLLAKIFGIDWDNIAEEETFI